MTQSYDAILARQNATWDRAVEAYRQGNPFATLCINCYGRHRPPNDEICPYDPPDEVGK
jgi:hypothetical protein